MFSQERQYNYSISAEEVNDALSAVLRRVYALMSVGLLLTGVIAWYVYSSGLITVLAPYFLIFMIAEIGLVLALSFIIGKASPQLSMGMFLLYSALNGITMSTIFAVYGLPSIGLTFGITAGMFALMSVIGFTTKTDMSHYRSFLLMGLVGFLLASIVNIFLKNPLIYWIITYFGIGLFLALTIYDTQKIKQMTVNALAGGRDSADTYLSRVSVMGALTLYLDFVNLFLLLLRIFGRRR